MQQQQSRVESDKEEIAVWTTIWNSWENNEKYWMSRLASSRCYTLAVCYDSFFSPRREEELHAEIMRSRKIDWTMMIADGWWSTICTIIFPRLDSSLHLDSLAVRAIIPTRNRISSHLWKSSFNANAIYAEHLLASSKAFGGLNRAIFSHSTMLNLQKRLPRAHTRCRWRRRGKVNTFLCFVHGVITSDVVEADIVAVLVSIT